MYVVRNYQAKQTIDYIDVFESFQVNNIFNTVKLQHQSPHE